MFIVNILGITHPISLNSAACLLKDGALVAFAEEERFVKIKHAPAIPPNEAITFCLKRAGLTLKDIDYVAIGYDSMINILRSNIAEQLLMSLGRSGSGELFPTASPLERESFFYSHVKTVSIYYQGLFRLPFSYHHPKVRFIRHHLAHIASAYYVSGFDHACIISADGGGGQEAGMLAVGEGDRVRVLKKIPSVHSLGYLYTLVTRLLGFASHDGEGKVMGLAAYGKDSARVLPFVSFHNGIAHMDQGSMYRYLSRVKKKLRGDPMEKPSVRLAADLQRTLEEAYVYMAQFLHQETGIRNFCLTGGVSLNCLANTKVLTCGCVDRVFVQPVSSDAGTALGAAVQLYVNLHGKRPGFTFTEVYYGQDFTENDIATVIKKCEIPYVRRVSHVEKVTARLLAKGYIVGWFQGRMEVGPRALGNRSILADPSQKTMKDLINNRIKGREPWRPFAPSILSEHADRYLEDVKTSPFMILESRVKQAHAKEIIAATHVDGTARPHTVSKTSNPRYWTLIHEFYALTGIPAVLNTSFNLSGEPIVCTPEDAVSTFFRTGLDYLVLGNYVIAKKPLARSLE